MSNAPIVSLRDVGKMYGGDWALRSISLELPAGARIGLVGPNGSGKTTLMSILAGLIPSHAGHVTWHYAGSEKYPWRYSPQDPDFPRRTTVSQLVNFYGRLDGFSGHSLEQEVQRVLQAVALWEQREKKAFALSHGMKKRLSIAQAMIGSRPFIMLDEPTAGLDPKNAAQIRNAVIAKAPSQTLMISSHNLSEIEDCCDYILVLEDGELRAFDSMAGYTRSDETLELMAENLMSSELVQALGAIRGVSTVNISSEGRSATLLLGENETQEVMSAVMGCFAEHGNQIAQIRKGSNVAARFLSDSDAE